MPPEPTAMRPESSPLSVELRALILAADFARRDLYHLQAQARRAAAPAERSRLATQRAFVVGRYLVCCNKIVDLTAPDAA